MIQERSTDVQIKYLLIKKFTYHDPQEAEAMCGHPIVGRIYRSVFNINTKHHRLLLPESVVMGFNQLEGTSEGASFELVEITTDNILDYNIVEEDFEVFHKSNDDIFTSPIEILGIEALKEKIQESMEDEIDFSQRASHAVLSLYQANPAKAEILIELAEYLNEQDLNAVSDITNWMRYHPSKGSFVNIAKALKALDKYSGEDKRTNEDDNDLFKALEAIVVELERIYTA